MSAGVSHTCGVRTTGRLFCWGDDDNGQLGNGGANTDQITPSQVAGALTDWTAVSAGNNYTCGRRSNGRLYCWGDDSGAQLGNGAATTTDQTVPGEVAGGATTWTSVSAGSGHTCGRRSTGRLYCWGLDAAGQLGDGSPIASQPTPVLVAGGATTWTSVTVGQSHTCGRRNTGRLYCWGDDTFDQLGNGAPSGIRLAPDQVAGGVTSWTSVSAGFAHTCGRRNTGRLYCWGEDNNGQLGDGGGETNQPAPVEVAGGATSWTAASAGFGFTCGRRNTGRLYCWGSNFSGQVGDGGISVDPPAPVPVAGGATDWAAVVVGGTHACGRITSGRLFCWGNDGPGKLGNGPATGDQPRPDQVWT